MPLELSNRLVTSSGEFMILFFTGRKRMDNVEALKRECLKRVGVMSDTTAAQVAAWIDFDKVKDPAFLQEIERILQEEVKAGKLSVNRRGGQNFYLRSVAQVA